MAENVKEDGWTLTAYCGCKKCCDKEDCISADGTKLTNNDAQKFCAAPKQFKFGTIITISGGWNGTLKVVDRGGAITGKKIDVWMGDKDHHQDALNFGVKRNCTIQYSS